MLNPLARRLTWPWMAGLTLGALLGAIALLLWSEGTLAPRANFWGGLENALIALMGEYPDRPRTMLGRIVPPRVPCFAIDPWCINSF